MLRMTKSIFTFCQIYGQSKQIIKQPNKRFRDVCCMIQHVLRCFTVVAYSCMNKSHSQLYQEPYMDNQNTSCKFLRKS